MIQRIQTIFFALAAGAFGSLLRFSFASSAPVPTEGHIFSDGIYAINDHILLIALTLIGILLSIIAIFLYKNRRNQMRTGYMVMVTGILIPLVAYLYFTSQASTMDNTEVQDGAGMFLPFAAVLCVALANFFIRKDERLVRSMDRLR